MTNPFWFANHDIWIELATRHRGVLVGAPPIPPAVRACIHAHKFALALGAPWRYANHQQRGATK